MRIKELRIANEYTQLELAEKVGCNQTAIGKYERGDLEPNIETLSKLSHIFNCSIDYLVGNSDDFGNIVVSSQSTDQNLSLNEKEMLDAFKHLSLFEQDSILVQVKALAEKYKVKK